MKVVIHGSRIHECLNFDIGPKVHTNYDLCAYRDTVDEVLK